MKDYEPGDAAKYAFRSPVTVDAPSPTGEVRTVSATGGEKGVKPQQLHQVPTEFLLALAEHYAIGNAKYPDPEIGRPNWTRGYEWSKSFDALCRHLFAMWGGEWIDPETGSPHIIAVAWHAATLYTFQLKELGVDDRPVY